MVVLIAALANSVGLQFAGASDEDKGRDAAPKKLEVEIVDGLLSLNGKKVKVPGNPEEIIKVLGKPNRESKLANRRLTWDELGIAVLINPKSEQIIQVSFSLKKESFEFSPKKVFAGKITVDGAEVAETSTISEINRTKKGKKFELVLEELPTWWKAGSMRASVYIDSEKDPKKGLIQLTLCESNSK